MKIPTAEPYIRTDISKPVSGDIMMNPGMFDSLYAARQQTAQSINQLGAFAMKYGLEKKAEQDRATATSMLLEYEKVKADYDAKINTTLKDQPETWADEWVKDVDTFRKSKWYKDSYNSMGDSFQKDFLDKNEYDAQKTYINVNATGTKQYIANNDKKLLDLANIYSSTGQYGDAVAAINSTKGTTAHDRNMLKVKLVSSSKANDLQTFANGLSASQLNDLLSGKDVNGRTLNSFYNISDDERKQFDIQKEKAYDAEYDITKVFSDADVDISMANLQKIANAKQKAEKETEFNLTKLLYEGNLDDSKFPSTYQQMTPEQQMKTESWLIDKVRKLENKINSNPDASVQERENDIDALNFYNDKLGLIDAINEGVPTDVITENKKAQRAKAQKAYEDIETAKVETAKKIADFSNVDNVALEYGKPDFDMLAFRAKGLSLGMTPQQVNDAMAAGKKRYEELSIDNVPEDVKNSIYKSEKEKMESSIDYVADTLAKTALNEGDGWFSDVKYKDNLTTEAAFDALELYTPQQQASILLKAQYKINRNKLDIINPDESLFEKKTLTYDVSTKKYKLGNKEYKPTEEIGSIIDKDGNDIDITAEELHILNNVKDSYCDDVLPKMTEKKVNRFMILLAPGFEVNYLYMLRQKTRDGIDIETARKLTDEHIQKIVGSQ